MPERIQRKRVAGWRMPEGAVYVGRPSRWGNPYYVGRIGDMRKWTGWYVGEVGDKWAIHGEYADKREALAGAVELYELHTGPMGNYELDVEEVRRALAGRDLVCWCPLPEPGERDICHAAVLLEVANG